MIICRDNEFQASYRMGRIPANRSIEEITKKLSLEPTIAVGKINTEWRFTIDGKSCGIWDYKGARWSVWAQDLYAFAKLQRLFPDIVIG